MPSQTSPVWNHEVTYHPEPTRLRDRVSNDYYWVALPDKIEKIGFEVDQCLELEKREDGGAAYLRGVPGDPEKCESRKQEHSNFRKIFEHSGNTWLSIPVDWIDDFIENRGDELLIVEINEIEETPHIRVYKNSDYNEHRIKALQDQGNTPISGAPVVVALATEESGDEEAYSLVRDSSYEADQFEIIPFDAQDDVFTNPGVDYQGIVSPEAVVKADERYGLSEFEVDKMLIEWQSPSSSTRFEAEDRTIYTATDSSDFRVKLPRNGLYRISVDSGDRHGSVLLNYSDPDCYRQNKQERVARSSTPIEESFSVKTVSEAVELADDLQTVLENDMSVDSPTDPESYYEEVFGKSDREVETNFSESWRGLYTFRDDDIYRTYVPVASGTGEPGKRLHWPTQRIDLKTNTGGATIT